MQYELSVELSAGRMGSANVNVTVLVVDVEGENIVETANVSVE